MYTDILINATFYENRIALVENGHLREFHLERVSEKGLIGNIYQGKVVRVLPGIDAAFVDIGLDRTGFLYVDEALYIFSDNYQRLNPGHKLWTKPPAPPYTHLTINQILREGQEILVQIAKEPIGSKGARLTCNITLPCRNLVFMPLTDHIGISRKIEDETIRHQLREKIEALRPPGTGFIVRTVAENIDNDSLEADMEFLLLLWDEILTKAQKSQAPALIYKDLDIILRAVRDFFTEETNELVTDNREVYDQLLSYAEIFAPQLRDKITYYQSDMPLFERYGVEADINSALDKKVWLRSGGYIVIEPTEALTVIDVNTGRYVSAADLSETIFKTNMEAVREIARQLRLRNLGGIIIIDFIDMENEEQREELFTAFQEAMRADKSKVNILKLSEFGLVQMTRKRLSESLMQTMCEPCLYCSGDGHIKSRLTICHEIFRKITRDARKIGGAHVSIKVHPQIAEMLLNEQSYTIEQLERITEKRFTIIPVPDMHIKRYDVIWNE
ncbi:Rne/Rng family ribonuclease [Desulfobulbus oligotrophicus]|jgi:ribonuclease G|uniref:Ribonuclease G n=1 Tax=Desulfobulbus oligotrophicus TaxID=1909699 RepID=A0A7T5VF78_9BACT|nr:Rne/Rng family ribonuclease [Desulfobulbus oligotrophicus]MDY0389960.1 Rne/Rng family ribonuclease [Desulfobulbus oligotrophicus]QQG66784.1 Rne/Rng family ribonuclease [Desulfobulbus oligotrophicus]